MKKEIEFYRFAIKGYLIKVTRNLAFKLKILFKLSLLDLRLLKQEICNEPVIVTLATYGPRIKSIHWTIRSLILQSVLPREITIWHHENNDKIINQKLEKYKKYNVIVKKTPENLGSYNKFFYYLITPGEEHILSADDDLFYESNWLEKIILQHKKSQNCVLGYRGVYVTKNSKGDFVPYTEWPRAKASPCDLSILLNTGAGVLIPNIYRGKSEFSNEEIMRQAPFADDLWFFALCQIMKIPRKVISQENTEIAETNFCHKDSLWDTNVKGGQNDLQFSALIDKFPEIKSGNFKVQNK